MKKYIFASDFDNTIYFRDGFHPEDILAIKEFQKRGNLFGLSTGRSFDGILYPTGKHDTIRTDTIIDYDFYLLVTGAYLLDKKQKVFYENAFEDRLAFKLYREYQNQFSIAVNIGSDYIVASDTLGIFQECHPYPHKEKVYCLSFYCSKKYDAYEYKKKIEKEYPELVAHQNGDFLDITKKECSKGNSIKILREKIPSSFFFGIGDNYNDIPLLDSVDIAFTFTYSPDVVKKHADYIVDNLSEAIKIAEGIISKSE